MLTNIQWPADRTYKSNSSFEPLHFYLQGLQNSHTLYLQLGYFSSSAIHLLSYGFAHFIARGGQVKLIINHLLSDHDKTLISNQYTSNHPFDLFNPLSIQKALSSYDQHFFNCLSYLIQENRLSFTIIKPKHSHGIAHYKSGLFYDGTHYVGYTASCNFTLYGLTENLEHLSVDLDWDHNIARTRNQNRLYEIQQIIDQMNDSIDYIDHTAIESIILEQASHNKNINELLLDENALLQGKLTVENNPETLAILNTLKHENLKLAQTPRFPHASGPRDYQVQAHRAWCDNNHQGIFAMATGTGKTITALNCLLEDHQTNGHYQALIVAPTKSLVEQWAQECRKFNYHHIILISSDYNWEKDLAALTSTFILDANRKDLSFIIIATYASLVSKKFTPHLHRLPTSTLFIADEAHNMGSNRIKKILPNIIFQKRIGLSATPERIYDEEGEQSVFQFFNDAPPFVYAYTMKSAIANGILCPYDYHPIFIRLTTDEQTQYNELSHKISKLHLQIKTLSRADDIKFLTAQMEKFLLIRKHIVHKAKNKIDGLKQALNMIMNHHARSLKYTLVYAPEGIEPSEDLCLNPHEEKLINLFTRTISGFNDHVTVQQFIGETKDREVVLQNFSLGQTDVLISMKCLDEGVDIPEAKQAIFCSSTGNPRQFIQRRGRILRRHTTKESATIYDLVVLPDMGDSITFDIEKKLIQSELKRVYHFASLAQNHMLILNQLEPILMQYDIPLSSLNYR
ncbi:DEAD/DEAH box helicase family protein [Wohlfahrtiimonas chitiniclastica]|uniref:DEAD/DEAH box helicase family protein n=1 Tax=Wohlfahrtiimonas chitiniclastica TaxID=400946 RepID=UPI001BCC7515|nr:DEAD/DEAH box helicase family protein [Wohlfahrtiimonas chitiniclastica]MBS7814171.1 DEAD/DEAH box helicase family protein [Wohlfahrtiimonas chitiniclastica]